MVQNQEADRGLATRQASAHAAPAPSSRARQDVETVVRSALELNSGISNCLENTGSAYRSTRLVLSGRSAVPMTAERPGLQPPAGFGSGHKWHQRPGVGAVAMGAARVLPGS